MKTFQYMHLDVFTERRFEGNQLAVFFAASGLEPEVMQAIAREMAFPESTFIFPKEDPSTDLRMRIFTPVRELPMAGHPTVGSTFALAQLRIIEPSQTRFVFGLGVGPTPVDLEWRGKTLDFAWMSQQLPTFGTPIDLVDELAAGLGLSGGDIRATGLPVQEVSCGVPFVMVPLASRETVDAARVDLAKLAAFQRAADLEDRGFFIFSFACTDDSVTAYSRMFAPDFGVAEDPATGGASGPLGCYLVHHGAVAGSLAGKITSLQGVQMGRPSRIHIAIGVDGDDITQVKVGGKAVVVGDGAIRFD